MKPDQTNTERHKVMIADNQAWFRKGLRVLLASDKDLEVTDADVSVEEVANGRLAARLDAYGTRVLVIAADLLTRNLSAGSALLAGRPHLTAIAISQDGNSGLFDHSALKELSRTAVEAELLREIRKAVTPIEVAARQAADLQALAEANRPTQGRDPLTQREKEVVRLLAEGMTVREAAGKLGLSAKTVEAHTLNLMRKLDIHNRASLLGYAVAHGMSGEAIPA